MDFWTEPQHDILQTFESQHRKCAHYQGKCHMIEKKCLRVSLGVSVSVDLATPPPCDIINITSQVHFISVEHSIIFEEKGMIP